MHNGNKNWRHEMLSSEELGVVYEHETKLMEYQGNPTLTPIFFDQTRRHDMQWAVKFKVPKEVRRMGR